MRRRKPDTRPWRPCVARPRELRRELRARGLVPTGERLGVEDGLRLVAARRMVLVRGLRQRRGEVDIPAGMRVWLDAGELCVRDLMDLAPYPLRPPLAIVGGEVWRYRSGGWLRG